MESPIAPYAAMGLAALQGRQAEVSALIEDTASDVALRGEGIAMSVADWANALLHNGLGRYPEAMPAAQRALHYQEYPGMHYPGIANWAAAELVEASARSGMTGIATDTYRWIAEMTSASGTRWALGVEARSRALVTKAMRPRASTGTRSCTWTGAASARNSPAPTCSTGNGCAGSAAARDAREQLRTAHDMLEAMGMEAFAERARRELPATGETARRRTAVTGRDEELTAQEAQIARLARDGLSNPEIGARLFISAAHRPVPPGQRLHQARDHLAHPSQPRPALADRAIRPVWPLMPVRSVAGPGRAVRTRRPITPNDVTSAGRDDVQAPVGRAPAPGSRPWR